MIAPRATARLQFNRDFTLGDAVAIVPYLAALGISHIYASPVTAAVSGSSHGYDVIDPGAINPEIGGDRALVQLADALRRHGMGLIVDIVPNHMAAHMRNPWWRDVLRWGEASRHAAYFDIDWADPDPALRGKVLLPSLGDTFEACLARGELRLDFDDETGGFVCRYFDQCFPIDPHSLDGTPGADGEEWSGVAQAFRAAAPDDRAANDPPRSRAADRVRLRDAGERAALFARFDPQSPEGRRNLESLLDRQHYRLACWRDAATRINWRRFFDINGLVALRMDRAEVFDAYHRLVLELFRDGLIDGVRVDHVDGMADPGAYCRRLRAALTAAGAPQGRRPLVVVEKILEGDEHLRRDWGVDGTTGYDFMDEVAAVLHDPRGEAELTALWRRVSGDARDFAQVARDTRREIAQRLFPKPLDTIVRLLRQGTDGAAFSADALREALVALLAEGHRYRLYGDRQGFDAEDRALLHAMRDAAAAADPELRPALHGLCAGLDDVAAARSRFQQLSATLTAKAVEDTAFYRHGRLLSRNEVGADPGRLAIAPAAFHARARRRLNDFPNALLATATHDHKRGEDGRARIAVLSEIPERWAAFVDRWLPRHDPPDPAVALMLYQTLVGAWPLHLRSDDRAGLATLRARVETWLVKALREAKLKTAWDSPDAAYEQGCVAFLGRILDPEGSAEFLAALAAFVDRIAPAGALNGLAQTLLRLTMPGIPDLYQGTEFWDFSLVDPDNRRPVDFDARRLALEPGSSFAALMGDWRDGRIKQALIARVLAFRQRYERLFAAGGYEPVAAVGPAAERILAFLRRRDGAAALVVVPRLCAPLVAEVPRVPPGNWRGTALQLPDALRGRARDVLLEREITLDLEVLLAGAPVALVLIEAG